MTRTTLPRLSLALLLVAAAMAPAGADQGPSPMVVNVQCPGDTDGDSVIDTPDPNHPDAVCMHLGAGDGFVVMADGRGQYMFGFTDLTGVPPGQVFETGAVAAEWPAPTIVVKQGQELFLSLTNVGMMVRPDLFDPHTVHWHGFPQAASIFDGLPEASISVNMGSTLTYYYNVQEPGTFMYHCHVEAAEHMQMGMLGNLYVLPAQNDLPEGTTFPGGFVHHTGYTYAYNDGDGSTYYDVEMPLQIAGFDPAFHDASETVQPLPFAEMRDLYPMLNGRGYPDTLDPAPIANLNNGFESQKMHSLIEAEEGQRILVRISSLDVQRNYTVAVAGIPMLVIAKDSRLLQSSAGEKLYFTTSSIDIGGGQSVDVILDTAGIPPGTYPLYTTNLNYLSNDQEDFGGLMTEIRILPAGSGI